MTAAFVLGALSPGTLCRSQFVGYSVSPRSAGVRSRSVVRATPQAKLRRGFFHRQREAREEPIPDVTPASRGGQPERTRDKRVFLISKVSMRHENVETTVVETKGGGGLFGVQAKAYWESIGVFPISIAAFGITALVLKLAKIKKGEMAAGADGPNRAITHTSIVTSEEEEAELHVFKCGGCGYEIYPARGREFKFYGDKFKCPCCGSPKSEFWDKNDPDDPRNQVTEDEDDDEFGGNDARDGTEDGGGDGSRIPGGDPSSRNVVARKQGSAASSEGPSET